MLKNTQSRADAMVERVQQHYAGMDEVRDTADKDTVARDRDRETGRFATGNRAQRAGSKGVVAVIKSQTNDYKDLIDLLVQVSKGQTIGKHAPTLKEMLDATIL